MTYSVYNSTYGTTTGSETLTTNRTLTCTGSSSPVYSYKSWPREYISTNGTIGSGKFSVYAGCTDSRESSNNPNEYSNYLAYKAFDSDSSSYWQSKTNTHSYGPSMQAYLEWYSSTAIKISQLVWTNYNSTQTLHNFTSWTLYGSNNNSSWTSLNSGSKSGAAASYTLTVNSSTAYTYHKLEFSKTSNTGQALICKDLAITATSYQYDHDDYYWAKSWS